MKSIKTLLIVITLVTILTIPSYSQEVQDSVTLDKKKVEESLNKLKARFRLEKIKSKDMVFIYPEKIPSTSKFFDVEVRYRGETIMLFDVNAATYEPWEIIDLR